MQLGLGEMYLPQMSHPGSSSEYIVYNYLLYFQDALFAFNPTAQTINPSGLKFAVKYSMKADAVEITDDMLMNNYTIEVSLLRSHSSAAVSEAAENIFTGIIAVYSWYKMK